jgi:hypothetical protein
MVDAAVGRNHERSKFREPSASYFDIRQRKKA